MTTTMCQIVHHTLRGSNLYRYDKLQQYFSGRNCIVVDVSVQLSRLQTIDASGMKLQPLTSYVSNTAKSVKVK